jgi:hypothetical protein
MTRQMIAIGLCIVTIVLLIASTNVSYIVRLSEGPIDPVRVLVAVSVVMLAAGLFVVLSKRCGPKEKHWAYGAVGTVVGFWLKG